ncbi:hypothetical protein L1987_19081 [Smallanthus sonchifolius]|uniref:Uncharacterized protein n=1 Tax=Smallanthus sonchifolius TaxID=185202 RepID=A0ACB9J3H1_9ASTR|nr:hypothetical protein L1987_19081 [Smallanthus sonchifolius]
MAMLSSFIASYENFIGGKIHDPKAIEEDYRQIDPINLEEMNIRWNMAMLMRQAKDFLKKTGRKYIGSNNRTKMGFDKSKVRWYNCQDSANVSTSTSSALVAQGDDNYDWGIHLEDLVGAVSQDFVAEIQTEDDGSSSSSDEESSGSEVDSQNDEASENITEEDVSEENIVDNEVHSDDKDSNTSVSEDEILLTKRVPEMTEDIPTAKVFIADMSDSSKVKDVICNIYCSNCVLLKDKMMRVMDDNTNLICDMKSMHTVNQKLKDNDKLCIEIIESLKRDINSLTLKIKEQAYYLDIAYAEIEKRNTYLADKNMELSDKEAEVIKLKRKLEGFGNSSFLLGYFNDNVDQGKQISGIGYVPPPFNGNYVVEPEIVNEEDLDPKTVLKVNPVIGENMVYDSESDDEKFDENKTEGVHKEVKIEEPKVIKQVTRDRCILTEPDECVQPRISKVLSDSGFMSAGDIKKEISKFQRLMLVNLQDKSIFKRSNVVVIFNLLEVIHQEVLRIQEGFLISENTKIREFVFIVMKWGILSHPPKSTNGVLPLGV